MANGRGRPKKTASERRETRFQIRLSSTELALIERAGGKAPSTWAREVLLLAAHRRLRSQRRVSRRKNDRAGMPKFQLTKLERHLYAAPRTTKLYYGTSDDLTLDEIEWIGIQTTNYAETPDLSTEPRIVALESAPLYGGGEIGKVCRQSIALTPRPRSHEVHNERP